VIRGHFIRCGFLLTWLFCAQPAATILVVYTAQSTADPDGTQEQVENQFFVTAGDMVEHSLAGGESHTYRVRLAAGRAIRITVEQLGSDLKVAVFGQNARLIMRSDRMRTGGAEEIILLADLEEEFKLVLKTARNIDGGAYRLTVGNQRQASELDRQLFEAETIFTQAEEYRSEGTADASRRSMEYYLKAATLWHKAGDLNGEAQAYLGLGMAQRFLGEPEDALHSFEKVLGAARESGNRRNQAEALGSIGSIHEFAGRTTQALQYHSKALSIFEELGDIRGIAMGLNNTGWVYWLEGQPRKALDLYQRALSLWRACGEGHGESATLHNMGFLYSGLGDPRRALDYLTQARDLRRELGDRRGQAQSLTLLGRVLVTLGEHGKALDCYSDALELIRALGDLESEAWVMNSFGFAHQALAQNQEALDAFSAALAIFQRIKNPRGEAETLNGLGAILEQLGDHGKALEHFERAYELYRTMQNPWGEATGLSNMGTAQFWMGNLRSALEQFTKARALFSKIEDRQSESNALSNIGVVYLRLGEARESLEYFEQALMLRRNTGERRAEANTYFNMGLAYDALGDSDRALTALATSDKIWGEVGSRQGKATSLAAIGAAERRRGNLELARARLESALEIFETVRENVFRRELRASYFSSVREFYLIYIDILMELDKRDPDGGYAALALEASERSRARGLLEILHEARVDIRQGVDIELLERERALRQQLDAREQYRAQLLSGGGGTDAAEVVREQVVELVTQLSDIEAQIRSRNPHYAALTQPVPLRLPQIQAMLDPETLLLEYALGKDRSFLWAVVRNEVDCFELPEREQIEREAKRVYELWSNSPRRELRVQSEMAAAQLSRSVLGPVLEKLNDKRLLIVADGVLQYIPFAALPVPQKGRDGTGAGSVPSSRPLAADHEIVMLPSASVVETIRRDLAAERTASKTIAVLADPVFENGDPRVVRGNGNRSLISGKLGAPSANVSLTSLGAETGASDPPGIDFERLPFTRNEADAILQLVPAEEAMKAVDFEASRAAVMDGSLASYRIVHFATHGVIDSENPQLSSVVLSLVDQSGNPQDGFLRVHEIYNLRLSADLVVLSGCRTALGQDIRGEGLLGLTRGFMYAGAPQVVASLWDVRDMATSELMTHFYRGLLKEKLRPAAALRQAQLTMRRNPRWAAPYFWAGFVLQGEWK